MQPKASEGILGDSPIPERNNASYHVSVSQIHTVISSGSQCLSLCLDSPSTVLMPVTELGSRSNTNGYKWYYIQACSVRGNHQEYQLFLAQHN